MGISPSAPAPPQPPPCVVSRSAVFGGPSRTTVPQHPTTQALPAVIPNAARHLPTSRAAEPRAPRAAENWTHCPQKWTHPAENWTHRAANWTHWAENWTHWPSRVDTSPRPSVIPASAAGTQRHDQPQRTQATPTTHPSPAHLPLFSYLSLLAPLPSPRPQLNTWPSKVNTSGRKLNTSAPKLNTLASKLNTLALIE